MPDNEIYKFYMTNQDFKDYIDDCVRSYGRDVHYMLETPIAKSVYREMQKGGCNERRSEDK